MLKDLNIEEDIKVALNLVFFLDNKLSEETLEDLE